MCTRQLVDERWLVDWSTGRASRQASPAYRTINQPAGPRHPPLLAERVTIARKSRACERSRREARVTSSCKQRLDVRVGEQCRIYGDCFYIIIVIPNSCLLINSPSLDSRNLEKYLTAHVISCLPCSLFVILTFIFQNTWPRQYTQVYC